MTDESCSMAVRSKNLRRRRPRRNPLLTKIAFAVTTALGITACCCCLPRSSHALSVPSTRLTTKPPSSSEQLSTTNHYFGSRSNHNLASVLFMAPQTPQPRRPRRMLKKRPPKEGDGRRRKRNRRNRHAEYSSSSSSPPSSAASFGTILPRIVSSDANSKFNSNSNTQEYRPLVPSVSREMGEDYWIDPEDLKREQRRKEEQEKQRIAFRGEAMPQEKLMTEVKAPYRQNWIGYFSLMVAVLSIIVSQFPELLEPTPTIRFPDL